MKSAIAAAYLQVVVDEIKVVDRIFPLCDIRSFQDFLDNAYLLLQPASVRS